MLPLITQIVVPQTVVATRPAKVALIAAEGGAADTDALRLERVKGHWGEAVLVPLGVIVLLNTAKDPLDLTPLLHHTVRLRLLHFVDKLLIDFISLVWIEEALLVVALTYLAKAVSVHP